MASTLSMAEVASALPEGEAAEATPPDADHPIRAPGKACIHDLINHGGRNVLVHDVCSFMSGGVHDLKGALCACRAFLAVLPQVVRRLEGFERRRDGDRDGWQASNDVVCAAARRFTNVRFISLADCDLLTDVVLIAVAHSCPHLARLNVANCRELTDAGLIAIAHHCPHLDQLDVASCRELSDAALISIAHHCPKLTKLCATSCKFRDPALIAIAYNCPALTQLMVASCELLDASIIDIAHSCPALAQLSVQGCRFVTSASIVEIAQNCGPNLTQLNLWSCGKMTDEVSEDIGRGVPTLVVTGGVEM
jgi:hypothetical protein